MVAYLIGEDGPYKGSVITLADGVEWLIGRDPDSTFQVLEDPMVSRRHARITLSDDFYQIENLSETNALQINGQPIGTPSSALLGDHLSTETAVYLQEEDRIQIGNNFFRFTQHYPEELLGPIATAPLVTERARATKGRSKLTLSGESAGRFMLKVISGPNQGAEFSMQLGESYLIGTDPLATDILFQDRSVSRQHAKISLSPTGDLSIEDLDSRNGVVINGVQLMGVTTLHAQDLVSMGTTSFLLIDREAAEETIYAPNLVQPQEALSLAKEIKEEQTAEEAAEEELLHWRETFIPTKHLIVASLFSVVIFIGFMSMMALFRTQPVIVHQQDDSKDIKRVLAAFPAVQFSYNPTTEKIFLMGHVLTDLDHSELIYLIKSLPFMRNIEDNIVVDEGVWQEMNALLVKNPNWRGVLITASKPGHFVMRGYLSTEEEALQLQEYVNLNFPYLNLLDNQVAVEGTLNTQIQNLLLEKGFLNVTFQLGGGEIIFAGRVNAKEESNFNALLMRAEQIPGIRQVKNFVIFTNESTARIDISQKYPVTGTSKMGDTSQYVLINGKILAQGDLLDGMMITAITASEIQLDKDGLKYKIDYNQP